MTMFRFQQWRSVASSCVAQRDSSRNIQVVCAAAQVRRLLCWAFIGSTCAHDSGHFAKLSCVEIPYLPHSLMVKDVFFFCLEFSGATLCQRPRTGHCTVPYMPGLTHLGSHPSYVHWIIFDIIFMYSSPHSACERGNKHKRFLTVSWCFCKMTFFVFNNPFIYCQGTVFSLLLDIHFTVATLFFFLD